MRRDRVSLTKKARSHSSRKLKITRRSEVALMYHSLVQMTIIARSMAHGCITSLRASIARYGSLDITLGLADSLPSRGNRMSFSSIFAQFVALIGGAALQWRRLVEAAPTPAWGSAPVVPAAKPQGAIPTLKM